MQSSLTNQNTTQWREWQHQCQRTNQDIKDILRKWYEIVKEYLEALSAHSMSWQSQEPETLHENKSKLWKETKSRWCHLSFCKQPCMKPHLLLLLIVQINYFSGLGWAFAIHSECPIFQAWTLLSKASKALGSPWESCVLSADRHHLSHTSENTYPKSNSTGRKQPWCNHSAVNTNTPLKKSDQTEFLLKIYLFIWNAESKKERGRGREVNERTKKREKQRWVAYNWISFTESVKTHGKENKSCRILSGGSLFSYRIEEHQTLFRSQKIPTTFWVIDWEPFPEVPLEIVLN